jgi:Domain of unknown function (DUF4380)
MIPRFTNTLIFIIILLSVFNMKQYSQVKKDSSVREIEPGVYEIRLDNISFRVSRNGGRIISFMFDGQEILSQNNIHGMFGSTLWPDPQSAWNWPPPPLLDEYEYSGGITGDSITLTSEKDETNGWQFEKTFSADSKDSSIRICYRIKNISALPKSVGPWEITRVSPEGINFFREGKPAELPPSDSSYVTVDNGIVWYAPDNIPFPEGKKFFAAEKGGWFAHIFKNILFVKKFPSIDLNYLAKGQGPIEIYSKGDKTYIEIENHGEHRRLAPEESMKYEVKWYLRKLPEGIKPEVKNELLVREAERIIR